MAPQHGQDVPGNVRAGIETIDISQAIIIHILHGLAGHFAQLVQRFRHVFIAQLVQHGQVNIAAGDGAAEGHAHALAIVGVAGPEVLHYVVHFFGGQVVFNGQQPARVIELRDAVALAGNADVGHVVGLHAGVVLGQQVVIVVAYLLLDDLDARMQRLEIGNACGEIIIVAHPQAQGHGFVGLRQAGHTQQQQQRQQYAQSLLHKLFLLLFLRGIAPALVLISGPPW